MKKNKSVLVRNSVELAETLNLPPSFGMELELRSDLVNKIIEVVKKKELTHAEVAKLAKTSRTRITALMNRNTMEISTDLMLRVISALGIRAKLQFKTAA